MRRRSEIRFIRESDCLAVLNIFRYYVTRTSFTAEFVEPRLGEFRAMVKTVQKSYPFLVLVLDGEIAGFAYAKKYRMTSGNQWSVETSIYVAEKFQGNGYGSILYSSLFSVLKIQGFYNVFVGIVLPNPQSVVLHEKLMFSSANRLKLAIHKFGRWHDVLWMQRRINEGLEDPRPVRLLKDVLIRRKIKEVLESANHELELGQK